MGVRNISKFELISSIMLIKMHPGSLRLSLPKELSDGDEAGTPASCCRMIVVLTKVTICGLFRRLLVVRSTDFSVDQNPYLNHRRCHFGCAQPCVARAGWLRGRLWGQCPGAPRAVSSVRVVCRRGQQLRGNAHVGLLSTGWRIFALVMGTGT